MDFAAAPSKKPQGKHFNGSGPIWRTLWIFRGTGKVFIMPSILAIKPERDGFLFSNKH